MFKNTIATIKGKIALAIVFLHIVLAVALAQEQNPIQNADFETGSLSNWTSPQQTGGTKTIHNVLSGSRAGSFALKITGDPNNPYNGFLTLKQSLTVSPYPQEKYVLSCNVRAEISDSTNKSVYLAVREINAQGQSIIYRKAIVDLDSKDWESIYCSFNPSTNATSFEVYIVSCSLSSGDKVIMDNISLYVDHQAKNLVLNGDFEIAALTDWTSPQQVGGTVTIHEVIPGSRAGKFVTKITGDTNNPYNAFMTLVQTLSAIPNSQYEYTLCGTVRSEVSDPNGKSAYIAIREINAQGQSIIYRTANIDLSNNGWCNTACKFTPSVNAVNFSIYVVTKNLGNNDEIFVDNIKFTVDGQDRNLILNGDYEVGDLTNWTSPQQIGGTVTIHEVIEDSQVGNFILEANGDPNNTYNSFLTLTQSLTTVVPDSQKKYLFCAYVCADVEPQSNPFVDDDRDAYLAIRESNSQGSTITYRKISIDLTNKDWNFIYCEFIPTAETQHFDVYVVADSLGDNDRVLVDNINLIKDKESEYAFNPALSQSATSPIELNDGLLQVIIDGQTCMINKIRAISENTTLQPAAENGMQIFVETLFGKKFTTFTKKIGTTPVQQGNTVTCEIEPVDRSLVALTGTVKYELINGVLTEEITLTALNAVESPLKMGVRHGFDASNWQNMISGLRPLRVLDSNQPTIFSYGEKEEDMNLNYLEQHQRVVYPLTILEGNNAFWLAGSCNIDEFVTISPNHPAGYFPSVQQNPSRLNAGQTLNFKISFKVFNRQQNLFRDVWRWYNQNISSNNLLLSSYVPFQSHSYRTFFSGCFASSTYFNPAREQQKFPGSSIWWYGWHDMINEAYPDYGEWWSESNSLAEKMTNAVMKTETDRLQANDFKIIYYFRQLANLRLKGSTYPDSWYRSVAGGALDLYGGGYVTTLPAHVASDVGYDTIPYGTYNFDNLEFRNYYISELMSVVSYYLPKAIGWDMGWESRHRGMFLTQAEVFNLLRNQYPAMKIVSNEASGPSIFYSDLVLLENGLLGGKSKYDFEICKALNTSSAVLERGNLFLLAVNANLDGTPCWLPDSGLALNEKYLDYLLIQRPELNQNRPEAARLCDLRMCLYDLALGASPGYMEEAKPVPASLSTVAGEILGMPLLTESFKVKLASGSDTGDQQAGSVWLDSQACRLVIYNDKTVSASVQLKLSISALTSAGWTYQQIIGGTAMIVNPEGESQSSSLNITNDANDVIFSISLPPFSALVYSRNK